MPRDQKSAKPVLIACMGPTGSGKSSFMALLGADAGVGHELQSCTDSVTPVPTVVDGVNVVLIDTPGFDDTSRTDVSVLRMIADFLEDTYEKRTKLTGLIYFHKITDNRVGGVSNKNIRLFENLCGAGALRNVVLCTTMWDIANGATPPEQREAELMADFWKAMISKGSSTARHDNTRDSAVAVIRMLFGRTPVAVELQEELVDRNLQLANTKAGGFVDRRLAELQASHAREMEAVQRELQAIRDISARQGSEVKEETRNKLAALEKKLEDYRREERHLAGQKEKLHLPRIFRRRGGGACLVM